MSKIGPYYTTWAGFLLYREKMVTDKRAFWNRFLIGCFFILCCPDKRAGLPFPKPTKKPARLTGFENSRADKTGNRNGPGFECNIIRIVLHSRMLCARPGARGCAYIRACARVRAGFGEKGSHLVTRARVCDQNAGLRRSVIHI